MESFLDETTALSQNDLARLRSIVRRTELPDAPDSDVEVLLQSVLRELHIAQPASGAPQPTISSASDHATLASVHSSATSTGAGYPPTPTRNVGRARHAQGAHARTIRVGINGFGRIGRNFTRAVLASDADIEIVGVNDLTDPMIPAHLLKYDSILGVLQEDVSFDESSIMVGSRSFRALAEWNPAMLP